MSARRLLTLLVFSALLAACTLPGVSKAPSAPYTGGTYNVGDTGPGGGIVFYVHQNGTFASPGSDCGSNCKYLEAAPSDFIGGGDIDVFEWCSDTESKFGVSATEIGAGMANTTTADAVCTSGAIQIAADYSNNGKTDWHLPSKDELNELYKYAYQLPARTSRATRPGFLADFYWSSSEAPALCACADTDAWGQNFSTGNQNFTIKAVTLRVRPVRAF
jgi:hypothetical protein